jgi:hypothetical protein
MPRGIKGSGKQPKAASKAPKAAKPTTAPKPAAKAAEPAPAHQQPLGSVAVEDLEGQALRDYALRIGMRKADVDYLTEERLRQNLKLFIHHHVELLTEA